MTAGLLCAELICQALLFCFPGLAPPIPERIEGFHNGVFFFRPHHYYALEINPDFNNSEILTNRSGLRGRELAESKPPGAFRIACLGSSTTQTLNEPIDSGSYPGRLETLLHAARPELPLRVINGGVGTYTSAETLIAYMFKISTLDPDLLVIYEGVNDLLADAYYRKSSRDYREYRRLWTDARLPVPSWCFALQEYSAILRLICSRSIIRARDIWHYSLNAPELTDSEALARVRHARFGLSYAENMERLLLIARHEGRRILLVTFIINPDAPPVWHEGIARLNTTVRTLAARYQLPCFDLAAVPLPADIEIFDDNCHFTAAGNAWRSRLIAEYILRENLLPAPGGDTVSQ